MKLPTHLPVYKQIKTVTPPPQKNMKVMTVGSSISSTINVVICW
jgi:hypothetical protein